MTTEGLDVDSNVLVENGSVNGGYIDHGWQKVTNAKKQKRQENKAKVGIGQEGEKSCSKSSDLKLFQALELEAEDRRARRGARIAAAVAARDVHSEEDSDAEGEPRAQANGAVEKFKVKKPKKPKVSVAEAAAAIDPSDLSAFLSDISESFASVPNVQLMRCADYFGRAFAAVTIVQFGWNKILRETPLAKTIEIPLCYIPDAVNKMLAEWLVQRPSEALSNFLVWILKETLDDAQAHVDFHKNSKVSAHRSHKTKVDILILLAILLRRRPDLLQQQALTLRNQFQGQDKLPTLGWAYGQAAQGDLVIGMYLWVHNLLPLAVGKSSTPPLRDTTLQFIESVLFANLKKARPVLLNGVTRKGERLVPAASLDTVMRAAFPAESAWTKATERFQALYPIIKELALAGSKNIKATRPVAQQLLPLSIAALSGDIEALSQEACSNFIWCLSQNTDCYKQWENLHLENLKASNHVLGHIRQEWKDALYHLSPLSNLKKTVQALRVKHKYSSETSHRNHEFESQLKVADDHCKAILSELSSVQSCANATLTLAAGAGIVYGFYLISPGVNPWNWDGWVLLSKTHSLLSW